MKRKIIALIILIFSLFAFVACDGSEATTTEQSIEDVIAGLDNPYNIGLFITKEPETSMGINFEMPEETTAYVVYKAVRDESYTSIRATDKTRLIDDKTHYLFEADLTGLEPGVTYEYYVRDKAKEHVGDTHRFTMPSDPGESFTFMYLADPQETSEIGYMAYGYHILYATEEADTDYDFVMFPGDVINEAHIATQWELFYKYSSVFSYNTPLVATTGNHDGNGFDEERINRLEFDGYMNLPGNGPTYESFDELEGDLRQSDFSDGKTFSFDYGNAHFTVVNSEMYCDGTTACDGYDETNAAILNAWIEQDLASHDKPWQIVLLHRGPYTLSYNNRTVRDNLVPILDEYGVDLLINGHDHHYSRAIYLGGEMIGFSRSDDYLRGDLSLIEEGELHFNHYSEDVGVTYLTGNTSGTKYYAGTRSSGIEVNYNYPGENPVIPFITVTEDSISVVSYVVLKESKFAIQAESVEILETFEITKE